MKIRYLSSCMDGNDIFLLHEVIILFLLYYWLEKLIPIHIFLYKQTSNMTKIS